MTNVTRYKQESLNIRRARPEDLEQIVEIYNQSIPGRQATADTELLSVKDRLDWYAQHQTPQRPIFVGEINQRIVAWTSLSDFYSRPAYDGCAEISIYLTNDQQGKGIGTRMLAHLIDHAKQVGLHSLMGFVFSHNEASLKLLHAHDFNDWGHFPGIAILDDRERDLTILGRKLK